MRFSSLLSWHRRSESADWALEDRVEPLRLLSYTAALHSEENMFVM